MRVYVCVCVCVYISIHKYADSYKCIQDPEQDPDPDPGSDPKKIIPDPQHCFAVQPGLYLYKIQFCNDAFHWVRYPAFLINAEPDPAFYINLDPDPQLQCKFSSNFLKAGTRIWIKTIPDPGPEWTEKHRISDPEHCFQYRASDPDPHGSSLI